MGPPVRQLWDHPGSGFAGLPLPGFHSLPDRFQRIWEAAVAFREVGVHEIRDVLRLWLRGEGLRPAARLAGVDRKTVRRYVAAAVACGLDRAGGEGQLGDGLLSQVAERVRPHRAGGRGDSWALLAAHHDQFKAMLGEHAASPVLTDAGFPFPADLWRPGRQPCRASHSSRPRAEGSQG